MGTTTVTKAEAANADLIRLDAKKFSAIVESYVDSRATEKSANAEAKAAEQARKSAQGQLLTAIQPARAAVCGNRVLTVKPGTASAQTITLKNGRKILLSDVTYFVVGKDRIGTDEISTLFGGRVTGDSIEVT